MLLKRLPLDLLPPQAVILAADVVLLSLPNGTRAESQLLARPRLPYGTVEVRSNAGAYQIAAMRLPEHGPEHGPEHSDEPHVDDAIAPVVTGADVADLAADLDLPSRHRLLSFLLGFCRKAFDLADDPAFAAACLRLAGQCVLNEAAAEPVAAIMSRWTVLASDDLPQRGAVYIIGANRVRRSNVVPLSERPSIRLVERVRGGDRILVLGARPGIWTIGPERPEYHNLLHPQPDYAALRADCIRALVPICPSLVSTLREMAVTSPAAPIRHDDPQRPIGVALEAALPDGDNRLFLRGWIRDPQHLLASAELCTIAGNVPLELNELFRFQRPDLDKHFINSAFPEPMAKSGFVAHIPDPSAGISLQPTLLLKLRSGARLVARPPLRLPTPSEARAAVLTSVRAEHVTDDMLEHCLGPAASAFHRRSLEHRGTPETVRIGTPVANPDVSIIVPLYRNLSFLRFQIAALATDPDCRNTELILVLDSPEQRLEAEHLLRGLHAVYDMPLCLLVLPRNLGYAAANNAGAAVARAPTLLLLNSDVVPAHASWLTPLRTALAQPGVGAVGPKLLFDDESLQHAGLFFQRDFDDIWLNAHYHKGMPRHWPAANNRREVPAITGAAILVSRQRFEQIDGICEDYIIGDYEDSDFCLRLRASGASTIYVPQAELFHFERRSITLHNGYTGTLACRYNRRLHHHRWDGAIADLMATPAFRPLALPETA